jgi:hypothetical protein
VPAPPKDAVTKFLLATIAVALWGILLRPLIQPTPVQADQQKSPPLSTAVAIATEYNGSFVVVYNGKISTWSIDNPSGILTKKASATLP